MRRQLCKSKIHGARVTEANLYYEGSLTLDLDLVEAADLVPYERIQVVNINNGARLETYILPGARGSGAVALNGAAARLGSEGDQVILISYASYEESEIAGHEPKVVFVDENNRILDRGLRMSAPCGFSTPSHRTVRCESPPEPATASMTKSELHPIITAAAEGRLPEWAQVSPSRRAHLERVVSLMAAWADALGLAEHDLTRWKAAAWLHDALRDAEPESLTGASEYPPKVRHGPAAAVRLRGEGVEDEELLEAIAAHTLGRPGLGPLGRYLFMADYLESGREFEDDERAALRARLPAEEPLVLREVCARRIRWRLREGKPLHPDTVGFWNELAEARR